MKKSCTKVLTVLIASAMLLCSCVVVSAEQSDASQQADSSRHTTSSTVVYNTREDIEAHIDEFGCPDGIDPDSVGQIIICSGIGNEIEKKDTDESESSSPSLSPLEWGAPEYYITNVSTTSEIGSKITESIFAYPGGTASIATTLSATYSASVDVDAVIISAALGVDVTASVEITHTQNVEIPEGYDYAVVTAYENIDVYTYEIWEEDLFNSDDYICDGSATYPIGVAFYVEYHVAEEPETGILSNNG